MPTPYRRRLEAAALNATCIACHADEAKQWQGSHHQIAFTNPAFQRALAIEPNAFCRGCHAPEADPSADPPPALASLGVACVTCHVTEEGLVLATPSPPAQDAHPAPKAPHPVRRSAEFAQSGACASCHEFRFPTGSAEGDGGYMQTTVREHRASPAAETSCAGCHMPLVFGKRSHAFGEVRDPAWLRSHLRTGVARDEDGVLYMTLTQTQAGHAFPTGDLFRRLEIGCELRDQRGRVLDRRLRWLARHFEMTPGQSGRRLAQDNRVFGDPKVLEFDFSPLFPVPAGARLTYWITYQRVATTGDGLRPAEALVESEVSLYRETIRWSDLPVREPPSE